MIIFVLILMTINVAWCNDNCPAFDTFWHPGNLQSLLSGTFLTVFTSAPVVPCHRVTYVTGANNAITGRIESLGCCVQSNNYNFTSTTELTYDIGPVPGHVPNCPLLVNETGSMNLIATTGSGKSLCLIVSVCQPDYYGINVSCKGPPPFLPRVKVKLFNLLGDLGLTHNFALKSVPQADCIFSSNNCPA